MKDIENDYERAFSPFWWRVVCKNAVTDESYIKAYLPWDGYHACNALYWAAHGQNGRGKSYSYHGGEEDPAREFLAHVPAYRAAWQLMRMGGVK